jgi:drug/metabolite transporter (DMT)-like permease
MIPEFTFSLAWLGLILYAVSQLAGDFMIIKGTRLVEAHVGSLILPFEAFFGALFAFMFFKETLTLTTILGGLLILTGAIIPNLKKSQI